VGSIHGGTKHNIIPDEVHMQLTVRAYRPEVTEALLTGIRRTAEGVARAAGVPPALAPRVMVSESDRTPATYNNPALTEAITSVLSGALGTGALVHRDPVMGGEDFGEYSLPDHSVPTCLLWLGAQDPKLLERQRQGGEPAPMLHSSALAPPPRPTLATGVKGMALSALHLLQRPEPLAAAGPDPSLRP
jgi:hippurate hydrolase